MVCPIDYSPKRSLAGFFLTTAVVAAAAAATSALEGCDDDLPEILVVRDFSLIDQHGARFDAHELRGNVWVASFFFTECQSICPITTAQLVNLQRRLAELSKVRFVSVSVDPETDTPARNRAYADRFLPQAERWVLLTGPRQQVREVVVNVLRGEMGEREMLGDGYEIPHSGKLLLVDQRGVLRGQYEPSDIDVLEQHLRQLIAH